MHIFDCKYISLKKYADIFEHIEIDEYIYGGVLEPTHLKPTRKYANCDGHIRQTRREYEPSKTYSNTSKSLASEEKCMYII